MVLDEPEGRMKQVVCMFPRRAISWLVEHLVLLDDKTNICISFALEIRTCIQGQRYNGGPFWENATCSFSFATVLDTAQYLYRSDETCPNITECEDTLWQRRYFQTELSYVVK
jgi:hypothetical protein